jgi:hypothetical protein
MRTKTGLPRGMLVGGLLAWATPFVGCDLAYPEVVIAHRAGAAMLIRNPSFRGCVWPAVLGDGDTTAPARCLPGEDRIHFQRLNVAAHCRDQVCWASWLGSPYDGGLPASPAGGDAAEPAATPPTWFNYQTITSRSVEYGGFHIFVLTMDDMEQDFSVPGPYGH